MFYIEAHNPLVINILNLNQNLNTSLEITMRNLLIMQENKFSGTKSMYPSTMQPLCTQCRTGSVRYLCLYILLRLYIDG